MNDVIARPLQSSASILDGATVAIRYILIPAARWTGAVASERLNLELVHKQIEKSPHSAAHIRPFATFYMDVTLPFTTRRQLPVVAIAGPTPHSPGAESSGPIDVEIEINEITTIWEGRHVTAPAAKFKAEFTDTVTLFDSGHLLYAPAFVLQAADIHSDPANRTKLISVLTSLAGFPGGMYEEELNSIRTQIRFRFAGQAEAFDLKTFVNRRLAALSDEQATGTVFSDLIRPILKDAGWTNNQRAEARRGLANLDWSNLHSVAVEVVGTSRYDEIGQICRSARSGTISVKPTELALAALAQNILDVENQDEHEVADSLSQAMVTDAHILTVHPKLTLRFSRSARSFSKMLDLAGGCPYFLLTNVVLAYNEHLLERSAVLAVLVKERMRKSRWQTAGSEGNMAREDLSARVQMFENETMYVLPNIFRYPTERSMFDEILRQRGLNQRAQGIERFTSRLYELRKDFVDLAEREATKLTNHLLMALAILQVSGLLLAALTIKDLENWSAALWIIFFTLVAVACAIGIDAIRRMAHRRWQMRDVG